jgi:hypothetical protein
MTLHPADAAELAEMLAFISDWLARDPRLQSSLADFVGDPGYGIPQLRDDLDRFAVLLGGSDGEHYLTGPQDQAGNATSPGT